MRLNTFQRHRRFIRGALMGLLFLVAAQPVVAQRAELVKTIDIEPVWAGHRVGFALLTHGEHQFVAYYDAERRMTVAQRRLGESEWTYRKLPRVTGWDSHNYITMAVDRDNHLHVAGDMHVVPLYYLRTTEPLNVKSLQQVEHMVGPEKERRVTYPVFIHGPNDELVFRYRDGGSGRGDDYYNIYDPDTRAWRRLLDQPLISGEGLKNAYATTPALGPDGFFHMIWVWRDTPDAATNHHLSDVRSRNLIDWTTAAGEKLELPITFDTCEVVDPVPSGGGIINGNIGLGFENADRPVVSYHKYDERGNTQIYNARFENGGWKIYQTSDWDYRWDFGGNGSIVFDVRIGSVRPLGGGELALYYRYGRGSGHWVLDEETLAPIPGRTAPPATAPLPRALGKVTSDFPGMGIRRALDLGRPPEPHTRYLLSWETLGAFRDRPRDGPLPDPVMLRLVELKDPAGK